MAIYKGIKRGDTLLVLDQSFYNFIKKDNVYYLTPEFALNYMNVFLLFLIKDSENELLKPINTGTKICTTYLKSYRGRNTNTLFHINQNDLISEYTEELVFEETPLLHFFIKNFEKNKKIDIYLLHSRHQSMYVSTAVPLDFIGHFQSLGIRTDNYGRPVSFSNSGFLNVTEDLGNINGLYKIPIKNHFRATSVVLKEKFFSLKRSLARLSSKMTTELQSNIIESDDLLFENFNDSVNKFRNNEFHKLEDFRSYGISDFLDELIQEKEKEEKEMDSYKISDSVLSFYSKTTLNPLRISLNNYHNKINISNERNINMYRYFSVFKVDFQCDFFSTYSFLKYITEESETLSLPIATVNKLNYFNLYIESNTNSSKGYISISKNNKKYKNTLRKEVI